MSRYELMIYIYVMHTAWICREHDSSDRNQRDLDHLLDAEIVLIWKSSHLSEGKLVIISLKLKRLNGL